MLHSWPEVPQLANDKAEIQTLGIRRPCSCSKMSLPLQFSLLVSFATKQQDILRSYPQGTYSLVGRLTPIQ